MATQTADPTTPASKPHGTTTDQVREMENEGQAQTQGRPVTPDPDEATPGGGDQDIDTAGTEADTEQVPGDTGSADIVGRTGEQMPRQSHDGQDS